MKMSSLFKKKKKLIAPPSGIYHEEESVDAEGSDGWKVVDVNDEIDARLKEEKEITSKNPKSKKKLLSKKKKTT